jgi:tRNA threonylcarbamoyladenosine biosynthesis protein TsaB
MVILAIDTITRAGSVALLDGPTIVSKVGDASISNAERLPTEALDWLAAHGRTLSEVDVLAVLAGPGSFTGLRVGLAAVQGLAHAGNRRALAIPTLEALAFAITPTEPVVAVACVDGQRGEVFYAAWVRRPGQTFAADAPVIGPAVGRPEELLAALGTTGAAFPLRFIGDGAVRYRDVWTTLPSSVVVDPMPPLAELAARLAATRPDRAGRPHDLRPIYLRRPDAELARERARARS